jgi:hypothetical protein
MSRTLFIASQASKNQATRPLPRVCLDESPMAALDTDCRVCREIDKDSFEMKDYIKQGSPVLEVLEGMRVSDHTVILCFLGRL